MAKKGGKFIDCVDPGLVSRFGPMRKTCRWIVEHEPKNRGCDGYLNIDVQYIGKGKWKIFTNETVQYLDATQLVYVASEVLGMTEYDEGAEEWWLPTANGEQDDKDTMQEFNCEPGLDDFFSESLDDFFNE